MPAILSIVMATILAVAQPANGQQPVPEPKATSPVADFIAGEKPDARQVRERLPAGPLPEVPDLSSLKALDPETQKAAVDAIREYYRYRQSGYEHRRRVFDWQLQSSKIIFWVVILMVGAGIYFSGVQFHVALRVLRSAPIAPVIREELAVTGGSGAREPAGTEPASIGPTATLQTSLEAGAEGIKISSPVLGVIILVISFLFFYLYLVHIYPISEIQ